jgi:Predicted metal-dependent hydrolase
MNTEKYLDNMIDISVTLSKDTIIYPGDPTPEYGLFLSLDNNDIANVGYIKTGIHHGTHVDVPYHFKNELKRFDEMPMEHWIGKVLVVDATSADKCVQDTDLEGIPLENYKRILLKTKNSLDYYKRPEFSPDFIYLDKSACELFVKKGIKTVGLDYITVDPHGSSDFPAHKTLLYNDVCIIECINLENVDPGEYFLMCLPLKLKGTDGAPARVMLLKKMDQIVMDT